ncbi:MAG: 7-cyano-7-deazaguanine synthase QueC [Gammaproteobacteria bacterium]|nr:7-cyano-7-deazaguanine synthase QueC [Gammaproteobacteria bacterium]
MTKNKALVIFSGGQDSTTCLYWAIDKFGQNNVKALSFDYGQRHAIELESAKKIAQLASVPHQVIPINTFNAIQNNALTGNIEVENTTGENGLPNTFVPGRNLIFITFAAAIAYQDKITDLITGVAQTDYSGYPDCRENTIESLQKTIALGMEYEVKIHTPLMHLNKQQTVKLAEKIGAMEAMAYTHTCYNGQFPPCGECPACLLREKGFKAAGVEDPLLTRANANV